MADPRRFTVKSCARQTQARANQAARKKGFFDNILNVGDLEILNDIGFGKVGKGLRVLSSVSDAIRTGKSAVPGREQDDTYNSALGKIVGTAIDAVSDGANHVIDTVGLSGVAKVVEDLNPEVVNRAYGQAKSIFKNVKRGNFGLSDIPEVFQDLQNLETLGRNIFSDPKRSTAPAFAKCGATPYAMDLIAFAPKFKFLFIVEIQFAEQYQSWTEYGSSMAFVVKTSSRPRFEVEYEEVNMYNFHTRVPKRVEYPPITMSFYDDNKNAAHAVYTAYLRAMSPIANVKPKKPQSGMYEQSGMEWSNTANAATFTPSQVVTSGHSASLGPLLGNTTSIISSIRLHHVFDYGNRMNTYHFFNPRITSFTPSELSQLETGDGTDFELEFVYDGLYIDHNIDLAASTQYSLKEMTGRHGIRPIDPTYDGTSAPPNGMPSSDDQESNAPTINPLADLASAAGHITDAFGNIIGGVADAAEGLMGGITDAAEGLLDGVTGQIGSLIPDDVKQFGSALGSDLSQARNAVIGLVDQGTGALRSGNFTKGLTGAINQNISSAQKAIGGLGNTFSNAFTKVKSFGGSFFS